MVFSWVEVTYTSNFVSQFLYEILKPKSSLKKQQIMCVSEWIVLKLVIVSPYAVVITAYQLSQQLEYLGFA